MKESIRVNKLIKFFTALFCEFCPSFYGQCISGSFPRLEHELKQVPVDEAYDKYIVTINLYDINSSARLNDIVDLINNNIGLALYKLDDRYVKLYKGDDKQTIPETDKTICHIRLTLEARVIYSKE